MDHRNDKPPLAAEGPEPMSFSTDREPSRATPRSAPPHGGAAGVASSVEGLDGGVLATESPGGRGEEPGRIAEAGRRAASGARRAAADLGRHVEVSAEAWKGTGAESLRHLARGLIAAAAALRQSDERLLASLAEQGARRVEGVAATIDHRHAREIYADIEQWAKRHPGVFVVGMALAGVALGRLLRASEGEPASGASWPGSAADPEPTRPASPLIEA
jgi:hypothetical protein